MKLDANINYIVSGLERSGTSMLMQMLDAAEIPVGSDGSRPADKNNPRGYYELEGGKIINRLIDGTLSLDKFKGKFIKITAYGIKFLPENNYKIIYSERNIEEILESMENMVGVKDKNRDETRKAFVGLNNMVKQKLKQRSDVDVLFVNYNDILSEPRENLKKIQKFLNLSEESLNKMVGVVDESLYKEWRK
jgi:hypothetical protein